MALGALAALGPHRQRSRRAPPPSQCGCQTAQQPQATLQVLALQPSKPCSTCVVQDVIVWPLKQPPCSCLLQRLHTLCKIADLQQSS